MGKKTSKQQLAPLAGKLAEFLTPSQCVECLQAFQTKKPTTFRFNSVLTTSLMIPKLLSDISAAISSLKLSVVPRKSTWHPFAYTISIPTHKIMTLPQFLCGQILFQNQSSMIPPLALSPLPDSNVWDMCAAPGGKTLGLLELMECQGKVLACEKNAPRFQKLEKFMSIYARDDNQVSLKMMDSTKLKSPMPFQSILCDAPCTGSGVISTHDPRTLKYFLNIDSWISQHVKLQRKLLESAYFNLARGGHLVYSTCSIFPEENEDNVDWFLHTFRDMELIKMPFPFCDDEEMLTSLKYGKEWDQWGKEQRPTVFRTGLRQFKHNEYPFDVKKCLRILPSSEFEGFFVVKFRKR